MVTLFTPSTFTIPNFDKAFRTFFSALPLGLGSSVFVSSGFGSSVFVSVGFDSAGFGSSVFLPYIKMEYKKTHECVRLLEEKYLSEKGH